MAGYSGGRKVIAPGVAHKDTITTFHSARFMEHPNAANCVLDGNPLHQAQLEIVEMLGGALALNTVIDEERRLSFVNFGEIRASHLAAVDYTRGFAEVPVAETFGTVVTSAAGYPLDKTYYQTVKGMVAPMAIMAEGADLIIASACSEGMGSAEFVDAQRRLVERGPRAFLQDISAKRFADIDEWQTEMQLKPMRQGSIQLYSDRLPEAGLAADRGRAGALGRGRGRAQRRPHRRPPGRGHPGGTLRGSRAPARRLSAAERMAPLHLHLDPLGGVAGDMFLAAAARRLAGARRGHLRGDAGGRVAGRLAGGAGGP